MPLGTLWDAEAARERIGAGLGAEPGTPEHEGALRELAACLVYAAEPKDALSVKWAEGCFESALARFRRVAADGSDPKLRTAVERLESGKASVRGRKDLLRCAPGRVVPPWYALCEQKTSMWG